MSNLEGQYVAARRRFGKNTATAALAEWIIRDDAEALLADMPAIRSSPRRLTPVALTDQHIGAQVSFARVGTSGAGSRIIGLLSRVTKKNRANGMPGYFLAVAGEEHGPLAPHHEVIADLPATEGSRLIALSAAQPRRPDPYRRPSA